jgi:thiol:disulfide interchange protein
MLTLLKRTLFVPLALLLGAMCAHAAEGELLPVDQAFKLETKVIDAQHVMLHWQIAENYYLYRDRIKLKSGDANLTLGALELGPATKKHDEYLGDVEVYHGTVDATQAITVANGATSTQLKVTVQGCHEVEPKICYPPFTQTIKLDIPAGSAAVNSTITNAAADALNNPLAKALAVNTPIGDKSAPLPPEQAFVFEAIATSPTEILARFSMPPGYYLYRDKSKFSLTEASATLGDPRWPAGKTHTDENFGTSIVYYTQVEVPIALKRSNNAAQSLPLSASFQGCLENGVCYPVMTRQVNVALAVSSAAASEIPPSASGIPQQSRPAVDGTFFAALLTALLGGLILNLMPCVLPILSLKAISLLEGGESPQAARRHVLFYSAGVLTSFAAIGFVVIGLRAAGLAYGWGFQLQQPLVVAVLVYVMLAIGLSLSGVVQFGMSLSGVGQNLTTKSGAKGDFFTGVLACVVASPCTAPFMGSALAYAFASPPFISLCIFLALGLGLALPFILIGFIPALGRWLPRPGAWMETLKQFFAFPMYLTAVWLVWVLGNQRGMDAVGLVLVGAVMLALGLWWFERSRFRPVGWRALAWLALLLALPPLYAIGSLTRAATSATQVREDGAVAFDLARLATLRAQGTPVFIDIGADWCTTCKVNEHVVLATSSFHDLLKRTGTVFMVGDWTNPDTAIEAFLAQFQAVGVPLYVVYPKGDGEGHVLPTVLTSGIVQDALDPQIK